MKKPTLFYGIVILLMSCQQKTRTITDHVYSRADSSRIISIKIKEQDLQIVMQNISNKLLVIKSANDSVIRKNSTDTIVNGLNYILSKMEPIKDTVYN